MYLSISLDHDRITSSTSATMAGVLPLMPAGRISTTPRASHLSASDSDRASAIAKIASQEHNELDVDGLERLPRREQRDPGSRSTKAAMSATGAKLESGTDAVIQSPPSQARSLR
jgi:hypothetical protein